MAWRWCAPLMARAFRVRQKDRAPAPGTGGLPTPKVTRRLSRGDGILIEAFKFLKSVTKRTAKVTMPSPSMLHFRGGREGVDTKAYPTMEEFYADLVRVWRDEINALGAQGCTYVQLDDTNLAYLCDPKHRERISARREDPDEVTRLYAKLITEVFAGRPASMTAAVHLCRGNARSNWMAEGGYEPVAEIMLNETAIDGFFLEYDDARSGGFEPLRFLPKDKRVVLGLITTKTGRLEKEEDVLRRIDEAAKYAPLDQLCLSPQCGFASTELGNLISEDEQRKKLELVVRVAEKVWGTAV
jgi:methionine synthase II (cobalamin-independent)